MHWEHTYDDAETEDDEAGILDRRTEQGWELVAVRKLQGRGWRDTFVEPIRFYFKRPQNAPSSDPYGDSIRKAGEAMCPKCRRVRRRNPDDPDGSYLACPKCKA